MPESTQKSAFVKVAAVLCLLSGVMLVGMMHISIQFRQSEYSARRASCSLWSDCRAFACLWPPYRPRFTETGGTLLGLVLIFSAWVLSRKTVSLRAAIAALVVISLVSFLLVGGSKPGRFSCYAELGDKCSHLDSGSLQDQTLALVDSLRAEFAQELRGVSLPDANTGIFTSGYCLKLTCDLPDGLDTRDCEKIASLLCAAFWATVEVRSPQQGTTPTPKVHGGLFSCWGDELDVLWQRSLQSAQAGRD